MRGRWATGDIPCLFVLHSGRLMGGSGEVDEPDAHAHGTSSPWACDSMFAPRGGSPLRFSIFANPFVYVLGHLSFFLSFLPLLHHHQAQSIPPIDKHLRSYLVRQGSSPGSSPVFQLHLIHEDGRDIRSRKLLLSILPPGDLSRLGL